jgi:hypothetical protein
VRSSWFGDLLRWRARTSCHTEFDCDRNACANSQPIPNCRAAHHSAAVRWIGFSEDNSRETADGAITLFAKAAITGVFRTQDCACVSWKNLCTIGQRRIAQGQLRLSVDERNEIENP